MMRVMLAGFDRMALGYASCGLYLLGSSSSSEVTLKVGEGGGVSDATVMCQMQPRKSRCEAEQLVMSLCPSVRIAVHLFSASELYRQQQ